MSRIFVLFLFLLILAGVILYDSNEQFKIRVNEVRNKVDMFLSDYIGSRPEENVFVTDSNRIVDKKHEIVTLYEDIKNEEIKDLIAEVKSKTFYVEGKKFYIEVHRFVEVTTERKYNYDCEVVIDGVIFKEGVEEPFYGFILVLEADKENDKYIIKNKEESFKKELVRGFSHSYYMYKYEHSGKEEILPRDKREMLDVEPKILRNGDVKVTMVPRFRFYDNIDFIARFEGNDIIITLK